jgi:hypothetical protein
LQTLDVLVAGAVEEGPRSTAPASPTVGACFIIGASPIGAWVGKAQFLAAYTSGGWRFITPVDGMSVYVKANASWANYRSGTWELGILRGSSVNIGGQQVVGSRVPAIASATGGATVDSQARGVIDQILGALRQHGLIET